MKLLILFTFASFVMSIPNQVYQLSSVCPLVTVTNTVTMTDTVTDTMTDTVTDTMTDTVTFVSTQLVPVTTTQVIFQTEVLTIVESCTPTDNQRFIDLPSSTAVYYVPSETPRAIDLPVYTAIPTPCTSNVQYQCLETVIVSSSSTIPMATISTETLTATQDIVIIQTLA
jgi:hypothetical protein